MLYEVITITEAERAAEDAYTRLVASGQVEASVLQTLKQRMASFSKTRSELIGEHQIYRENEQKLSENSTRFQAFLVDVERISSERMLKLDMNAGSEGLNEAEQEEENRITSYNVCYTKLLRMSGNAPTRLGESN